MKKRAVFLDRDGTVCEEVNYLARAEDLKLFPFAAAAIALLGQNDFSVALITNQSGIARGFFSENDLQMIHQKLEAELADEDAKLDGIYYCPHIPADNCDCRKPKIDLINRAAEELKIDLEGSWMIGDKIIDVETGFNAHLKTALVLTGYGKKELSKLTRKPDLIAENLLEAARIIVGGF